MHVLCMCSVPSPTGALVVAAVAPRFRQRFAAVHPCEALVAHAPGGILGALPAVAHALKAALQGAVGQRSSDPAVLVIGQQLQGNGGVLVVNDSLHVQQRGHGLTLRLPTSWRALE